MRDEDDRGNRAAGRGPFFCFRLAASPQGCEFERQTRYKEWCCIPLITTIAQQELA
jgi:hypothetical protein